jgi:hypothetical protein
MQALSGAHGLGSVHRPCTDQPSVGVCMAMCELRGRARCGHSIASAQRSLCDARFKSGANIVIGSKGAREDHGLCRSS